MIKANGPQERPPPPANAHESSLRTPASYPEELAKRQRNAIKRAERAKKKKAKEEENLRLLKEDLEKKKAKGISEGLTKHKHDPSATVLKRKRAPKKKAKPAVEADKNDSLSSRDDPADKGRDGSYSQ